MNTIRANHYLLFINDLIVQAGNLIEETKLAGLKVIRKDINNMVTNVDIDVQNFLIEKIQKEIKIDNFITEEMRCTENNFDNYIIIDPIDGTHNFIAGLPFYNISIALVNDGEIELGSIYFPQSKELYYAAKGQGSFRNGVPIKVSENNRIEKSVAAYDNLFLEENSINNFLKLNKTVFTTRIFGVASRDACFISEGNIDSRIWNKTKLCDIAAGKIIVEEAGGLVSDFEGISLDLKNIEQVIMSNGRIHEMLIKMLGK